MVGQHLIAPFHSDLPSISQGLHMHSCTETIYAFLHDSTQGMAVDTLTATLIGVRSLDPGQIFGALLCVLNLAGTENFCYHNAQDVSWHCTMSVKDKALAALLSF